MIFLFNKRKKRAKDLMPAQKHVQLPFHAHLISASRSSYALRGASSLPPYGSDTDHILILPLSVKYDIICG